MRTIWMNLRLFWESCLLSYVALFHWFRPVTYVASKIASPLTQILFFTFLGTFGSSSQDPSFYVIGNAVQLAAVNGIYGVTMAIGGDRWNGTLGYLFGTPANRLVLFLGRAFIHVIDGALGVAIGLMWGAVLLGVDYSHTNMGALALTILVTTFSTSGLGLLMGCLSLMTANVMFVNNTVYFSLLIFSGANIPIVSMPAWMQAISAGLPLTRGIAAARALIAGSPPADVAPLLVGELLVGTAYALLGYVLFRWVEYQAKSRGTLETI